VDAVPLRSRGLAETAPDVLGRDVLAAWDAFLAVVTDPATDLERPSRLPGWSGRDTCVHLGSWPDAAVLDGVLASARAGGTGDVPHPDRTNAGLLEAHRDATVDDVVASLHEARARVAGFLASDDAVELGRSPSRSAVGPLPVLSLVHAGCYELAVHAMDLAPCGAPPPSPLLLQRGLAALVDVTGGLAAARGIAMTLTAATPDGGWRFTSGPDGWTTEPHGRTALRGTGVQGAAPDLLDASAGRVNVAQLVVSRRMHVHDLGGWMRLAPLVESVPGLPGGPALRAAVAGLSGVGAGVQAVGRVLGRLRR
jgi:hypothetical protein